MNRPSIASAGKRGSPMLVARRGEGAVGIAAFSALAVTAAILGSSVAPALATNEQEHETETAQRIVLAEGHIDAFHVNVQDGELQLTLEDEADDGEVTAYSPDDVELRIKEQAKTGFENSDEVPEALRGEEGYHLTPELGDDLLWPGWAGSEVDEASLDLIDIDVEALEGPGDVFFWTEDEQFEVQLPGVIELDDIDSAKANWAFSEPGTYELTVSASAVNTESGEIHETNSSDYLFTVGDPAEEPAPVDPSDQSGDPERTDDVADGTDAVEEESRQSNNLEARSLLGSDVSTSLRSANPQALAPMANQEESPEADADRSVCWNEYKLDEGHTDVFYLNHNDGQPFLALKDDTVSPYEVRNPLDVELHAKQESLATMPESEVVPEGIRGQEVYHLPLTQQSGLLWPGWESQPLGNTGYDQVDIKVTNVDGPGDVYLWSEGSFGSAAVSLFDNGGFTFPGTIHQEYLAHTHAHWAFTEPGAYHFTVSADAINSSTGERVELPETMYLFTAGNDIPQDAYDCRGIGGDGPSNGNGDGNTDGNDDGNDNAVVNGGDDKKGGAGQGGSGNVNGSGSGNDNGGRGSLPMTGFSSQMMTSLGVGLLAAGAGAGALLLSRRQREAGNGAGIHASL
ncbi:TIGR03773 family transporter-associated surface protein [Actinomycetaceae bacterium L2_0104]